MFCSLYPQAIHEDLQRQVKINLNRDSLIPIAGMAMLRKRYMIPGERSPQEAFARAATAFATDLAHAQRLYDYVSRGWFMFATPLLSNGGTSRGLPISCFLNYVEDSREGLAKHYTENIWLSTNGGGIGAHWSDVRSSGTPTSRGAATSGVIPFIKVCDSQVTAFHQGGTRRGSYAAYLDIDHPEIEEFLDIRKPTGGDANRRSLNIHHGVNITDVFMNAVRNDSHWALVDPHTGEAVKAVKARDLWIKILEARMANRGEPYLFFIDTAQAGLPESQKQVGFKVRGSNLCTEITLATGPGYTAVCCLSSVNVEKFNEWLDHDLFIRDLVEMLDNALDVFIKQAPPELEAARRSAMEERSIGLGQMGLWSYMQKYGIEPGSEDFYEQSEEISRVIWDKAISASVELGHERGIPPFSRDSQRNAHVIAIAPNASSSIILGVSPSIEPWRSNAFLQKILDGSFVMKNPALEGTLERLGMNDEKTWRSIVTNEGSVQHLDIPQEEKDLFKTAVELDQFVLVNAAADRQGYVCQAQSLNLFFPATVDRKTLHDVHWRAWGVGLKSLYYVRSESVGRTEKISEEQARLEKPSVPVVESEIPQACPMTVRVEEEVCIPCQG